jgi:predicted branched-subunit amino acid permease
MSRQEMRAGARAVAPMLIGIIPFGLVVGATSVTHHFGIGAAVGLSTIVFAGASQLAILQALAGGGSAIVAAVAAWTINLRILLYSASLAPELTHETTRRRLGASYFLTDQAYAVCITRWKVHHSDRAGRLSYYLGAAVTLWVVWQFSTVAGALVGAAVPADVPLDFAVPLVFLVLLVPTLTSVPAVVAAAAGGFAAVAAAELGAGALYIVVGAVAGILAGALAEAFLS